MNAATIVRASHLAAMMANFAWPMTVIETPSQSQGRYLMCDANRKKFAVLYDVSTLQARAIAISLNSFHERVTRDVAEEAAAAKAAETKEVSKSAFEQPQWPVWAGPHPRYGAMWGFAEVALLHEMWAINTSIHEIASVLGRDDSGVRNKLGKELGLDFEEARCNFLAKEAAAKEVATKQRWQEIEAILADLMDLMGLNDPADKSDIVTASLNTGKCAKDGH